MMRSSRTLHNFNKEGLQSVLLKLNNFDILRYVSSSHLFIVQSFRTNNNDFVIDISFKHLFGNFQPFSLVGLSNIHTVPFRQQNMTGFVLSLRWMIFHWSRVMVVQR